MYLVNILCEAKDSMGKLKKEMERQLQRLTPDPNDSLYVLLSLDCRNVFCLCCWGLQPV